MDLLLFLLTISILVNPKDLFPQTEAANFFEYEIERLFHIEN